MGEVGAILIPILRMRKLRFRKDKVTQPVCASRRAVRPGCLTHQSKLLNHQVVLPFNVELALDGIQI